MRSIVVSASIFLLLLGTLNAANISIRIDYRAQKVIQAERDIVQDNSWTLHLFSPPKTTDSIPYYLVLNFTTNVIKKETIYLRGFYAEPREIILNHNDSLILKNEEDIPREFSIVDGDGTTLKVITIKPHSSETYVFDDSGDYKIKDSTYFWNVIHATVLTNSQQAYLVSKRTTNISISNKSSGSYNLKIYRGTKWIFQEDFTVVGTSSIFPLSYIIKDGDVIRTNTPETPLINVGIDGATQ